MNAKSAGPAAPSPDRNAPAEVRGSLAARRFPDEVLILAEAGLADGFLLPDDLADLCRAVLDHFGKPSDDFGPGGR